MTEIVLRIKRALQIPVEAGEITPEMLCTKRVEEIRRIRIWEGNRQVDLAEVFEVTMENSDRSDETTVRVIGDASKVRKIGYKMSSGSIIVDGNVGMYLGEEMSGGSIEVTGDAGRWLGMKMKGGSIEIKGNATDYIGAGYRGTTLGMNGGSIHIHGNAGNEVGCFMRNGTVKIEGNAGLFPGIHMSGGAILIQQNCEGRAGAQMRGGKVIIGGNIPSIVPGFVFEEIADKAKFGEEKLLGPFYVFSGDTNEEGKGKLSVSSAMNPELKWYEKYQGA